MNSPAGSSARKFDKSLIVLLVLIGLGSAAWIVESNFGVFNRLAVRFFGPPKVESRESFTNDSNVKFDHSLFHNLLQAHVDEAGWVDYEAMQSKQPGLDAYLETIRTAKIDEFGRDERLAFLINCYNAFTIKLIVENFPIGSIKDIASADRWDAVRWNLAGKDVSLSQIEHELIRPNFVEPRIHFALVCAAVGCPPLRNEAYTGEDLATQLAQQTAYVHNHVTWFRHDSDENRIELTQLYKWYGDDFVQVAGSVLDFIRENSSQLTTTSDPAIKWLNYDWKLNNISNKTPR